MTQAPSFPALSDLTDGIAHVAERHIDLAFRAMLARSRPGESIELADGCIRVITGQPHPFGNFVMLADPLDEHASLSAIEPLLALDAPVGVLSSGGPLGARLESLLMDRAFHDAGGMTAMCVDLARVAQPPMPRGCEFIEVVDDAFAQRWEAAFAEGFELPPPVASLFSPTRVGAAPDAPVRFFAIVRAGEPVSTAALYLDEGVAGIYCVSTPHGERGKGLGGAVTAGALRHAAQLGYRTGVLQATAMGYAVYRRLGFRDVGTVPVWVRVPGE